MNSKKRKAAEISGGDRFPLQENSKRIKREEHSRGGPRQSFEQIQKAEQSKKFKEDLIIPQQRVMQRGPDP